MISQTGFALNRWRHEAGILRAGLHPDRCGMRPSPGHGHIPEGQRRIRHWHPKSFIAACWPSPLARWRRQSLAPRRSTSGRMTTAGPCFLPRRPRTARRARLPSRFRRQNQCSLAGWRQHRRGRKKPGTRPARRPSRSDRIRLLPRRTAARRDGSSRSWRPHLAHGSRIPMGKSSSWTRSRKQGGEPKLAAG